MELEHLNLLQKESLANQYLGDLKIIIHAGLHESGQVSNSRVKIFTLIRIHVDFEELF